MDGIRNAKSHGVPLGRRTSLSSKQVTALQAARQQGTLIPTLMREFNVSKATIYRYLDGIAPLHEALAEPQIP